MTLEQTYEFLKKPNFNTSDICEHLDTLKGLAHECEHITEMGFRAGTSFCAFLMAQPKTLITYDLRIPKEIEQYLHTIKGRTDIKFIEANTLETTIEETDLLFIDTLHTYAQLKKELELHGNKAKKYLAFHDTNTFGKKGEDGTEPGLQMAMIEFVEANPHWHLFKHFQNNNGLTILARDQHN